MAVDQLSTEHNPTTNEKLDQQHVEVSSGSFHSQEAPEPVVTPKTWLVVFILSMGYGLSFWPIPVLAAAQSEIATALGNTQDFIWFIPSWSLAITVCFLLTGANADLFGRRWFLVGGNLITFVGQIVLSTATSTSALIAGCVITGFGAANCQMAAFALSELLPNKWRHLGVVFADLATLVAVVVGPVTARYGVYVGNWRWNFYSAAILQFLSFLGLYLYYHPPRHPNGIPYKQALREMDYGGMLLFILGATPTLLGIVYSTIYPSKDVHVVAPIVVGVFVLGCFACWEHFGHNAGWVPRPLTPTRVFTAGYGRELTFPCIAVAIINMFYYSTSIIFPTAIVSFWISDPTDWREASILSLVQGFAICTGVVFLSFTGSWIKRWNWQLTGYTTIMVTFGVLLAFIEPDRKGLMIAFVFLSQTGYAGAIYLSIAISQLGVEQKDLGLSGGLSGCLRFAGGAIATAVYTTILTNTVTGKIIKFVPAAVSGLIPSSEIPSLMGLIGTPSLATTFSPQVVAAVQAALTRATVVGLRVTALSSLAFGVVGIIACALCLDVDHKMDNKINVYMENTEYADRNEYH